MDKIQEIKDNAHHFKEHDFFTTLHYEDYLWLTEQAEKVERYEKALNEISLKPYYTRGSLVGMAQRALENNA